MARAKEWKAVGEPTRPLGQLNVTLGHPDLSGYEYFTYKAGATHQCSESVSISMVWKNLAERSFWGGNIW